MDIDLAVVMPVYNEEECIVSVVESWLSALSELNIRFRIVVLNDGSTDHTQDALKSFDYDDRVKVINQKNRGHGPTILIGYQESVKLADWTFQCDSDNEMKPDSFRVLWQNKGSFDALFGVRVARNQSTGRALISACSRAVVRLLFGRGITDVNTPYRLMRSDILKRIIDHIPANTFAPNIVISGVFCKCNARIFEHPVLHEHRKTGRVSIVRWKLWESAAKAFWQTLLCWAKIKSIDYQVQETL